MHEFARFEGRVEGPVQDPAIAVSVPVHIHQHRHFLYPEFEFAHGRPVAAALSAPVFFVSSCWLFLRLKVYASQVRSSVVVGSVLFLCHAGFAFAQGFGGSLRVRNADEGRVTAYPLLLISFDAGFRDRDEAFVVWAQGGEWKGGDHVGGDQVEGLHVRGDGVGKGEGEAGEDGVAEHEVGAGGEIAEGSSNVTFSSNFYQFHI